LPRSVPARGLGRKSHVYGIGKHARLAQPNKKRAGFLTSAAESGAGVLKMVEVSRHKSIDMLRTYVRRADLFREHAGAAFL